MRLGCPRFKRKRAIPAENRVCNLELKRIHMKIARTQIQSEAGFPRNFLALVDDDRILDRRGLPGGGNQAHTGEGRRLGALVVDGESDAFPCALGNLNPHSLGTTGLTEDHRVFHQCLPLIALPARDGHGFDELPRRRNQLKRFKPVLFRQIHLDHGGFAHEHRLETRSAAGFLPALTRNFNHTRRFDSTRGQDAQVIQIRPLRDIQHCGWDFETHHAWLIHRDRSFPLPGAMVCFHGECQMNRQDD